MSKVKICLNDNMLESDNFKWHEVLFLPQWKLHVFPNKTQYDNLIYTVSRLELIRKYIGLPIIVVSGLRPQLYNIHIKGAKLSPHINGCAIDFKVRGLKADRIREILEPVLADFDIRMERLPEGSMWVHIDTRQPGITGRYFNP